MYEMYTFCLAHGPDEILHSLTSEKVQLIFRRFGSVHRNIDSQISAIKDGEE